jgi:1,4-dihydroxy-2-naphthoyl-CoA synthase
MANKILKNGPVAVAQIKNAIQVGVDMSTEGASEYCQKNAMMTCVTKDGKEGLNAFREKRPPKFTGK